MTTNYIPMHVVLLVKFEPSRILANHVLSESLAGKGFQEITKHKNTKDKRQIDSKDAQAQRLAKPSSRLHE